MEVGSQQAGDTYTLDARWRRSQCSQDRDSTTQELRNEVRPSVATPHLPAGLAGPDADRGVHPLLPVLYNRLFDEHVWKFNAPTLRSPS